ncbi:MAG TPA: hypothetical protein VF482_10745 [Trebonia sp.]
MNRRETSSSSASVCDGLWWNSASRRAPARTARRTAYSAAACPEERQSQGVIPVQVGEQHRAGERLPAEQPGDVRQAVARVEEQRRRFARRV